MEPQLTESLIMVGEDGRKIRVVSWKIEPTNWAKKGLFIHLTEDGTAVFPDEKSPDVFHLDGTWKRLTKSTQS